MGIRGLFSLFIKKNIIMANRLDMIIEDVVRRELGVILEKESKNSKYKKSDNGYTGGSSTMMSNDAENSLIDQLDNEYINLAAVARKLYPGHTKEGAQSQLRKKLKHLKSDSGSKYHLKKGEGSKLKSIIADMS